MEDEEEYFCNRCCRPITEYEYYDNVDGYCPECYEEVCLDDEDWTDNTYLEDEEDEY